MDYGAVQLATHPWSKLMCILAKANKTNKPTNLKPFQSNGGAFFVLNALPYQELYLDKKFC
jgi:hypothetical protein